MPGAAAVFIEPWCDMVEVSFGARSQHDVFVVQFVGWCQRTISGLAQVFGLRCLAFCAQAELNSTYHQLGRSFWLGHANRGLLRVRTCECWVFRGLSREVCMQIQCFAVLRKREGIGDSVSQQALSSIVSSVWLSCTERLEHLLADDFRARD